MKITKINEKPEQVAPEIKYCGICHDKVEVPAMMHVDPSNDRVYGVACPACSEGLHTFKTSIVVLESAIKFLLYKPARMSETRKCPKCGKEHDINALISAHHPTLRCACGVRLLLQVDEIEKMGEPDLRYWFSIWEPDGL